ncbi:MAG: hypothetical protein AAFY88_24295, partial [Acidobacteriota bacterium]
DDGAEEDEASPQSAAPAASGPPPPPGPPAAPVPPTPPGTPAAAATPSASTPGDQSLKPAPPPPPPRGKRQLPIPLVVGGVALVVVLGGLFAILSGRSSTPEPSLSPAPSLPAPPPPVAEVEELGSLLVFSTPWAEVTEITDSAGFVHDLPADPTTPLHLRLPEGLYRVTLAMPAVDDVEAEERICEVRVGIGEDATCTEVVGEPTAIQFFKDSGWWP